MLAGQALKAIYKVKSNLLKFPEITVQHKLDLFDKSILPMLNYGLNELRRNTYTFSQK